MVIKMPDAAEMESLALRNLNKFGIPDLPLGVDGTMTLLQVKPRINEIVKMGAVDTTAQNFWCRLDQCN